MNLTVTLAGVALAGLVLALQVTGVSAEDDQKRYSVRGLGTTICSKFLESRNLNVAGSEQYAHWLQGFLTAYNYLQPQTYEIAPGIKTNGLLRYMDLYCGKNPTNRVVDGAVTYVAQVYAKRKVLGGQ
ncbi:MAG: hypothetical protein ACREE7_09990 [Dongiaceae bacterium]